MFKVDRCFAVFRNHERKRLVEPPGIELRTLVKRYGVALVETLDTGWLRRRGGTVWIF